MQTRADDLTTVARFSSSYSNDQGGQCVQGGRTRDGMAVRDSKDPQGPAFVFSAASWMGFVRAVKGDQFGR